MTTFKDLERKRAEKASALVLSIQSKKDFRSEYCSLARDAAVNFMTNGLGQTLAFWNAKRDKKAYHNILSNLSDWVLGCLSEVESNHQEQSQTTAPNHQNLLSWVISSQTTMAQYRWATREAIAFSTWLKRFAEAELSDEAIKIYDAQVKNAAREENHDTSTAS